MGHPWQKMIIKSFIISLSAIFYFLLNPTNFNTLSLQNIHLCWRPGSRGCCNGRQGAFQRRPDPQSISLGESAPRGGGGAYIWHHPHQLHPGRGQQVRGGGGRGQGRVLWVVWIRGLRFPMAPGARDRVRLHPDSAALVWCAKWKRKTNPARGCKMCQKYEEVNLWA